ncbi:MAG: hypothetical protein AAF447_26145 [Myxococcota bacterium]
MKKSSSRTKNHALAAADRAAPALPNVNEVLRRCRGERLGLRFADNLF